MTIAPPGILAAIALATTTLLASGAIGRASTADGRDSVAEFLLAYVPETVPTLAAPGLSPHGQMRAVDFHVQSGGNTVAGPDTQTIESVWLQAGWRDRLWAAVIASGAACDGPLEQPDEPWHHTFRGTIEPPVPRDPATGPEVTSELESRSTRSIGNWNVSPGHSCRRGRPGGLTVRPSG